MRNYGDIWDHGQGNPPENDSYYCLKSKWYCISCKEYIRPDAVDENPIDGETCPFCGHDLLEGII